jgi:hypothetical protein
MTTSHFLLKISTLTHICCHPIIANLIHTRFGPILAVVYVVQVYSKLKFEPLRGSLQWCTWFKYI